ncbi:MAG: InlB B-repeat-containing protein [Acholeplasmataceae bacterium]|nr:InlB B-repeat-containing protein [Acholeplasmataceae bacterium]
MKQFKQVLKVFSLLLMLLIITGCTTKTYKVTFLNNEQTIHTEDVKPESMVTKPTDPVLDGYQFDGWYEDSEFVKEFKFDQIISKNINIYAKFIKEHTITFVTEGSEVAPQIVLDGQVMNEVTTTKALKTFEGWYKDSGFTVKFDVSQPIKSDLTLYANFIDPDYQALLNADIDNLNLPDSTSAHLELPSKGENGAFLTYKSDNPKYLTDKGNVSLAEYNSTGVLVNLTVTASLSGHKITETFTILIEPLLEEVVENSIEVEFESLADEYIVAPGVIDIYYMQSGAIPYVDVSAFLYLLDGALDSVKDAPKEYIDDDNEVYYVVRYIDVIENSPSSITVKYIAEYTQNDVIVETESYEAVLDFTNNTLTTENFDFFNALGASTETDFGEGLTYGNYTIVEGNGIMIDFNQYRIDLVTYETTTDTMFLMPQALANLIFVGQVYYDTYFNGDKLYGFDSYQILDGASDVADVIKQSSKNTENIPSDLKRFTYDYLALTLDYFYGLKPESLSSYYTFLAPYADNIMHRFDTSHYKDVFNIVYGLDDLHTYHQLTGYYEPASYEINLTYEMLGQRTQAYYEGYWTIDDLVTASNLEPVRVTPDGKTGIVTIDSFDVDTPNQFKADIDGLLSQNPTIKNIVVDITNNGGGNLGAVWRTMGYMTDDVIMYHSMNRADGSSYSQEIIDAYPAYDLKFYIMTSSVTFSAANLMAATAKEMGFATVIGLPSSGGASSIGGIVTPTGDVFFMSSSSAMSTKLSDGTLKNVEYGVTPDILFTGVSQLFNDEYIQTVVNGN